MNNTDSSGSLTIQYPYAVDEFGILTYIGNVERESRHDHTFTCPNCGKSMIPRLGEHNAHCFAHDRGKACGKESYIHRAAKKILAKRFNESESFTVTFTTRRVCKEAKNCVNYDYYHCGFGESVEYDLKKFYDLQARIEYTIVNNGTEFRPDVALLSSDSKRSPIFLEVLYKHKSTEDKIRNYQCIEFRIKDFNDLHRLENEPIVESEFIQFLNFKDRIVTPEHIETHIRALPEMQDFKSCDCFLPFCKQSKDYKRQSSKIRRFTLYKSGKTYDNGIFEDELDIHKPSAIAEVTYYDRGYYFNPSYTLALKDDRFRTCQHCEHYVNWCDEVAWCKLVKNGSTRKGTFDFRKGSYCKSFVWAMQLTAFPQNKIMLDKYIEGYDYFIWISKE